MNISNNAVKTSLEWMGKNLHSPEQRLILGATALATQPFIDLHNKDVDKETRKTSAARTIAKIIAGTLVGFAVRKAGISYVRKYSQYTATMAGGLVQSIKPKDGLGMFVPMFTKPLKKGQKSVFPITVDKLEKKFELYRKAMGTFVATVAMIATNFILDAPLTKFFTNIFQKQMTKNLPEDGKPLSVKNETEVKQ